MIDYRQAVTSPSLGTFELIIIPQCNCGCAFMPVSKPHLCSVHYQIGGEAKVNARYGLVPKCSLSCSHNA